MIYYYRGGFVKFYSETPVECDLDFIIDSRIPAPGQIVKIINNELFFIDQD